MPADYNGFTFYQMTVPGRIRDFYDKLVLATQRQSGTDMVT